MSGINIANGVAANSELKVNNVGEASVVTTLDESLAGFMALTSEVDAGLVTGARISRPLEVSEDYRLRVGVDTPLFNLNFEGAVQATHLYSTVLSTMTAAQANGNLMLNTGSSVLSGAHAVVRTYRPFTIMGATDIYAEFIISESNYDATNVISEWGLGLAATTATPTDGVLFRRISGGQLQAVVNVAGSEVVENIDVTGVPNRDGVGTFDHSKSQHYVIAANQDRVVFWINNIAVSKIRTPSNSGLPLRTNSQPAFARIYNAATAGTARTLSLWNVAVILGDYNTSKPWGHVMAGLGGGAYQTQPGTATAQTATYAVGAAAGAGTWTASTAPATNTLGGLWTSPATLPLGAETDYPIFAYLNPAGTNALPGKTLYITGIRIGETVVTSAMGANASWMIWGVGAGSTASSLATTDAVTTVSPKRIVVGTQAIAASAAAGNVSAGIAMEFGDSPLVVPPGTYAHVIARIVNNTAAGALRGSVTILGYFE